MWYICTIELGNSACVPAFDLRHILSALPLCLRAPHWRVLWLGDYLWVDQESEHSGPALLAAVEADPCGIGLTWQELVALAKDIRQVVYGVFVGYDSGAEICTSQLYWSAYSAAHPPLLPNAAVIIEAVDSSHWHVASRSNALTAPFQANFGERVHFDKRSGAS